MIVLAGRRVAQSQDEPLALGNVPRELAAGVHLAVKSTMRSRGMTDSAGRDANLACCGGKVLRRGGRLALDVLDAGLALRRRHRQHGDVLVEIVDCLRPGQHAVKGLRPLDDRLGPHDSLHGQFGRDPRAAAAAPAGVVVHVDFQAQAVRLLAGVLEQFPPQRPGEIRRPLRSALVHFHIQHAADADPLQRLQVGGDSLLREIAAQREPIDPGPRRLRRPSETLGQILLRPQPCLRTMRRPALPEGCVS